MPHPDILDEPERLRKAFAGAVALHAAIAVTVALAGWASDREVAQWGDPKSLGGGSVGITAVDKIPLPPRQGIVNPVANDTESVIPAPPKPQPQARKSPEPDAIAIKSRNAQKRQQDLAAAQQKYRPYQQERPSQVYSSTGAAAVSPMFSQAPGGGGVGSGSENPFGYGFGWYAQLLREKVARNWRREGLDTSTKLPPVIVFFDLQRDGGVRNARVVQSSGNYALDQSAVRAVLQSSPFQPLPQQLPKDSYTISFEFYLNR